MLQNPTLDIDKKLQNEQNVIRQKTFSSLRLFVISEILFPLHNRCVDGEIGVKA